MVLAEPGRRQESNPEADSGRSLPGLLAYWAAVTPEADFLETRDLKGQKYSWTYLEFRSSVLSAAEMLKSSGLAAGDRCVLHTGNSPGFMTLFWAVHQVGAVAVPTIAQYSADELAFVVDDCNATMVITTEQLAGLAETAIGDSGRILLVEGPVESDGDLRIAHRSGDPLAAKRKGELGPDVALVLYTSGTTSRPKGVMLTHESLLFTARTYAEHFRLQTGDRTLVCLPLFHANGLLLQMIPVVFSGGSMLLTPRFSASQYWRWVDEFSATVTHLVAGPIRLLRSGDAAPESNSVRLMSFGMPLTSDEIAGFEDRFGIPLVMVWGSTETGCGGTIMPLDSGRRPGHQNIGRAMPGWQVKLVDPETSEEVPVGDPGEIRVRSEGVMHGYLGQPETTSDALRDGWVLTGDLGWVDRDGYFHFVDRLKDMLKPSGENVAASEVERVVTDHPQVHKCAVVGMPDEVRMEVVVAAIVPELGTAPEKDAIRDWCSARLASFKVPSRIEFFTELPETSIGKTRKAELKQLLASTGEET
ncbi:MAG: AMP-binding protein [Actinomycetota bacterium]|nr:AMP-binding protein [Actinomycetota bacterium]